MSPRRACLALFAASLVIMMIGGRAGAASSFKYCEPVDATKWIVGAGGDECRTNFNPTEKQPPFIGGGHLGTGDSDGPWLEWSTKISDLPSAIFPGAGLIAEDGILYVSGGATNSFLALSMKTGLPVWRFSPDQRTDGYTAAYPASNAPVIKNGVVYTTFSNGFVYALDAKTGRKIWSYEAKDKSIAGIPPPGVTNDDLRKPGTGPFDPIRPDITYTKIHGVTAYCDGRVLFMTLGGWAYSLDAKTGGDVRKVYADSPNYPGELKWWEYGEGGALNADNSSAGSSTRRFEAVPGLGCMHHEVIVYGSDGHIRWYKPKTMAKITEYNRIDGEDNFCQNAGWNCDMAIGLVDPLTGDLIATTLDSRTIRINLLNKSNPWNNTQSIKWRRTYEAPFPFQVGSTLPLALEHLEHGFITQAVVGGPPALDVNRQLMFMAAQDGHLYVLDMRDGVTEASCGCGKRPSDPNAPPLLTYFGISANTEPETPYTRQGEGGPWDYNQHALSSLVLGGNVLYVPTWDHRITAYDVRDATNPKRVWTYQTKLDETFKYPPFGETFKDDFYKDGLGKPFSDIDLQMWGGAALLGGHLYIVANDGVVYSFNLQKKVKTTKNLVVLGSGAVPFLPEWTQKKGAFDNVWTPHDWYKNQVAPTGYRFPTAAGAGFAGIGFFALASAGAWWWIRRREDIEWETE